jgi:COMMD2-7/10, HN domain
MSFSFTMHPVEDAFYTAVQNLNAFTPEQLGQFADCHVAHIRDGADLAVSLFAFARQHRLGAAALQTTARAFLVLLQGAVRHACSPEQFAADLRQLGVAEDRVTLLSTRWQADHDSLATATLQHTLSVNQLLDFEWRFGGRSIHVHCSTVYVCVILSICELFSSLS